MSDELYTTLMKRICTLEAEVVALHDELAELRAQLTEAESDGVGWGGED